MGIKLKVLFEGSKAKQDYVAINWLSDIGNTTHKRKCAGEWSTCQIAGTKLKT